MATFHLLRTRSGKLLLTTEQTMKPDEMDHAAKILQTWSQGPDTGVLLIPDCVFELEVVDDEVTFVRPAVAGSCQSHPPVATERQSNPVANAIAELLVGSSGMKAIQIYEALNLSFGINQPSVRQALARDPRFTRDERGFWALVP